MSIDEECAKARERREEIECSHLLVCWREREREGVGEIRSAYQRGIWIGDSSTNHLL